MAIQSSTERQRVRRENRRRDRLNDVNYGGLKTDQSGFIKYLNARRLNDESTRPGGSLTLSHHLSDKSD